MNNQSDKLYTTNISISPKSTEDWSEKQYDQLKNQLTAYKYLIRNMPIPVNIIENIRTFSSEEWELSRKKKLEEMQEKYSEKFENQGFSMKELGLYFRQRNKEEEKSNQNSSSNNNNNVVLSQINSEKNFRNEMEYNIESEIENRKNKLEKYLENLEKTEENKEIIKNINSELQLLRIYFIQKKIRKEIVYNYVREIDKFNGENASDSIFHKMLLERRAYKKPIFYFNKRNEKLNDKFERQLRNGYDMRKKEKQRELLNNVINQYREFTEFHKDRKNKYKKKATCCKNYIENSEIKDKREKDRKEKERIQYLKQNNIEEYIKMLKEAKDSRLHEFMDQTDQFLKEIEDKIKIQKDNIAYINHHNEMRLKENSKNNNESESELNHNNNNEASNDNNNSNNNNNEGGHKKELIEIEEENNEKDEKMREKVYNSKNYYLSAHSHLEEINEQPHMLKFGRLKSYQIVGLQWLVSLYVNNLNGILADEMGLGKTIQTIALLCYIMETKHNDGPFLIIAPLATISNWVLEFNRWGPDIKVVVYKGPPTYRRQLSSQIKLEKHRFNVVLTTYEYIMKDKYSLNKITWQYIIVDEGHRMKNHKSKFTQTLGTQFNSVYRLLLTGTPLQNNLSELWALLNFLLPKIFNSCEDFEKWFNQPFSSRLSGEKNTELTEEQELLIIHRLHTVLRPFLLRREKKDVEKELPSKTEYVIKLDLSAWQKIVYKEIKEKGLLTQDPATGKMEKKALNNTMMQLRKICNHPFLFLNENNELFIKITDWIYRTSGKFEFLDRIIPKLLAKNHKILIFSQMTHLMNILECYFIFKGIRFLRLDGNTKSDDRGTQIQLFSNENSEYKVFILSTRAGGLGLNLQAADTVIIFDSDWNPQMDIQAEDRCHRIGQKQKVKVFRLISKKTIEEGILEKAAFKKSMDEKVIRAGLYNVKYSENERKKKLLDILKSEKEEEEEEDEILDDSQINEYISRSDEEYKLFEQMDKERYILEKRDEKLKEIKEKMGYDDEFMKNVNYRLLQDYEVPEWIKISNDEDKNEKIQESEIAGKYIRKRTTKVNYRDDEDDFLLSESYSDSKSKMTGKKKKRSNNISYDDSKSAYSLNKKKQKISRSSRSESNKSVDVVIEDSENNEYGATNIKIKIDTEGGDIVGGNDEDIIENINDNMQNNCNNNNDMNDGNEGMSNQNSHNHSNHKFNKNNDFNNNEDKSDEDFNEMNEDEEDDDE